MVESSKASILAERLKGTLVSCTEFPVMNTDDVEVEMELGKIKSDWLIAESRSSKSFFGLISIFEKVVDSKFFSGFF